MRPALRLALLCLAAIPPAHAADDPPPGSVAEALARRITGPDLAQSEIKLFCEERVPRMPDLTSLEDWERTADRMRRDVLDRVIYRGEAARWRKLPLKVEWLDAIEGGPGYRIRKLRYEAVPGFWIPALLYEPETLSGRVPAVLNFDGHDPKGMFADYKQVRCINLAKRGMIALNVDWIGMGQLRSPENAHGLLNALDLCGTSGVAVFSGLQSRGVDVLLSHANVDPARIAATGLSGGGWQTIFLGAFDTRVRLIAPVAGYSSFLTRASFATDLGDSEQTPSDLATVTDYAQMTALLAPRPALLTFNARDDCCFAADHALPLLLKAARPVYHLYGVDANLRTHVNTDPGTHNYLKDNREAFYRMLRDHFDPTRPDESAAEIPVDAEVKSADVLRVPLPADNASLHSLALGLARSLPRDPALPTDPTAATAWQVRGRQRLAELVKLHRFNAQANPRGSTSKDGVTANLWAFDMGMSWTVPGVELVRGDTLPTLLIVADSGRSGVGPLAEAAMARGYRVLAIDPFDIGEAKLAKNGYLWNLYLATLGRRPVGIRASQITAVARWASGRSGAPVAMVAVGPRSSIAALIAAALEPEAIGDLEVRDAPGSFKEAIEAKLTIQDAPDRFCFGLLESFDVPQIAALIAPRPVAFTAPSPRAKTELKPLEAWYKLLGRDFDPAP